MRALLDDRARAGLLASLGGDGHSVDQPLVAALYTLTGGLMEALGPMFWAALVVLFIQAALFAD